MDRRIFDTTSCSESQRESQYHLPSKGSGQYQIVKIVGSVRANDKCLDVKRVHTHRYGMLSRDDAPRGLWSVDSTKRGPNRHRTKGSS